MKTLRFGAQVTKGEKCLHLYKESRQKVSFRGGEFRFEQNAFEWPAMRPLGR